MAINTFAAIDVGSREISMKIFQVTKTRGVSELTHLRHKLLLGAESYAKGGISYPSISEVCHVLKDYTEVMKEYNCTDYVAYATSAVREADNNFVFLDQVKSQTGIKVKILSNSEQRFLRYKAIALKENFFEQSIANSALVLDSGAGSVQFSLIQKGVLVSTQNLKLGSDRIYEILGKMDVVQGSFEDLINEYMEKDLNTYTRFHLKDMKVKNLVTAGDRSRTLKELVLKENPEFDGKLTRKQFLSLKIPKNKRRDLLTNILLIQKMFEVTDAEYVYLSSIDLCDSIVAEHCEKKLRMIPKHDFEADIISAAKNIASRYLTDTRHTENVSNIALEIFDHIKKFHGLGKRERLLLHIAIILHGCGQYINMQRVMENSFEIIMTTEIIGLSHRERELIAYVVRYEKTTFPDYKEFPPGFDKNDYITAVKLSELLRLSNNLDKSNRHKINKIQISLKETELQIKANTLSDLTLEKTVAAEHFDSFEAIFGVRPVLKQRRGGKNYGTL